ncbi:DUF4254 domain-containing protein [Nocardia uniformis]|uniref:DUF4254 domain-containing protein n=1 Tax=Nocardia uniformis TaxID=53432 RepID=A0A849BXT1_9NOCA|nr:DUF4254 domain-containing protein [Nocardia uniformis]NNH70038.1 DUF4254 domain-containing protein [Nocardia uniformis]
MNPLPAKDHVLAACRGIVGNDHPVLRWASELATVHQRRLTALQTGRDELEGRRRELVNAIDTWVAYQLPPSLGCARLHTESLGAIIDRLSEFTAVAHAALAGAADYDLWDAWEALAELAVGYDDLQDEVSTGRRRLPGTR